MVIRAQNIPRSADRIPVAIIGGGGCGMTAAIALQRAGIDAVVFERDASPMGTTAMSTGLIPGAGSRLQKSKGIDDSAEIFALDIVAKTKGQCDADFVRGLTKASGRTIDWLADDLGLDLSLVEGFLYPGHSRLRMHGMPSRSGAELMGALSRAAEACGVSVLTRSLVEDLIVDDEDRVLGMTLRRPDGALETYGCDFAILACCGFAGNPDLVKELIPELTHATFYGHPGNKGDAMRWTRDLGAAMADIGGYQGHAGLAVGHGIPILWPLIAEGGIQVNAEGNRFADESRGYSDQAVDVLAQTGHFAWSVFDEQRHRVMLQFADYKDAMAAGCIITSDSIEGLAQATALPHHALMQTVTETHDLCRSGRPDRFGRSFAGKAPLEAPFYAVKVTGALFHTQGGCQVTAAGQVRRASGGLFPNLYAGGGAARGVSGPGGWGYIAGNGLMTATTLGRSAGEAIAAAIKSSS